jgi:predicted RNA binding protein YcfA (HicA-like mRNA interferase family)
MATKKMKINFKMPTPTAAERLHALQQKNRKAAGLPDPSEYKKKLDAMKSEEVELLDEMPESNMKVRDVHSHLKKAGWELARSKGGHDVFKHPKAKHSIPVPRHALKAPLVRGIMKASKVEEQLEKKGRFVSGPIKQPFKSDTIVTSVKEAKDAQEYDYEGDMAKSDLRSILHHAKELHDMIEDNTNLAEWCQAKITLAEDYLSTVANYMRSEMNEEVKKNEYHIAGKHKFPTKDEHAVTVKHTESGREHVHSGKGKYLSKLIKTRYNINHYFEEVELDEMIVVKTNKPIGTRVADIGPGGKEYNVKTDKAYDDAKKKQPQGAEFAAQRRKERLAKNGRMDEKENLPGLWANIHAKRKRGEPPAKPGDKDYPKTLNIESAAEPTEGEMKGKQQGVSRKAQIVRDAAGKSKKTDNPDKFQKDPELSSEIHKT